MADHSPRQPFSPAGAPPTRHPLRSLATSADGEGFIRSWEGTRQAVYRDIATNPTIGVGHLLTAREGHPGPLSPEQVEALYQDDLRKHEQIVRNAVKVPLTQGEFDALVSLAFNVPAAFGPKSTLLNRLNGGDYAGAARQFLAWRKAHAGSNGELVVVPGLEKRRGAEADIFLGGPYRGP